MVDVVDVAGAVMGGARRYVAELDRWLERGTPTGVSVIGRGRRVDARWLVARERVSGVAAARRCIALNNVSFVASGNTRVVLLANALHFLYAGEDARLSVSDRVRLQSQGLAVRTAARRAHRIVVPSDAMRCRVANQVPSLVDRLEVLHHPLTASASDGSVRRHDRRVVLCPVLRAPYKQLGVALRTLATALNLADGWEDAAVWATLTPDEALAEGLGGERRVVAIGHVRPDEIAPLLDISCAVFFPSTIEAFGYPLAEARVRRIPVIAPSTALTREVAGDVAIPYSSLSVDGLADSLERAARRDSFAPLLENPFDPAAYFERLFLNE